MGNSLQDQLLKSGLVDEKRAKQVSQKKRQQAKQQRNRRGNAVDENRLQLQKEQARKAERDRELNRRRKAEAEQKALVAQIRQLITDNRLPKRDGEVAYNFADGSRVKRLYVTDAVQKQLGSGSAAIVKLHGQYDIVPREVAEKIRERDSACIIVCNDRPSGDGRDDDPYAGYEVPDDLMW